MAFDELIFHNRLARAGTIIDVGANKGEMSLHFSTWERQKLVAFEPFPPSFEILSHRLTEGFGGQIPARVRLVCAALGEKPGFGTMRVPKTAQGVIDEWASLAKTFENMAGVDFEEVQVPVWTIDGLNISDIVSIKIDAEGYEAEVLHGARKTLQYSRPIISIECEERHRKGCTWYIPGFMRALDYNGFWYDYLKNEFFPVSKFDAQTMQIAASSPAESNYGDFYIFQFYFLPRENHELHLLLKEIAPINYD